MRGNVHARFSRALLRASRPFLGTDSFQNVWRFVGAEIAAGKGGGASEIPMPLSGISSARENKSTFYIVLCLYVVHSVCSYVLWPIPFCDLHCISGCGSRDRSSDICLYVFIMCAVLSMLPSGLYCACLRLWGVGDGCHFI